MEKAKPDIRSMTLAELKDAFAAQNLPKYRAEQVFRWVQQRGVTGFSEMTDLSQSLRAELAEQYELRSAKLLLRRDSKLDSTKKYLFELIDGETVESVLMEYKHGFSLCISTQVGCKMGCTFCATGQSGFSRDLAAGEMLAQIQAAERDQNIRVGHVVLMGMGEPLDNYENVLRFLELVSDANGMNIGMRHISLSTCGLADRIRDLAEKKLQLTLSVSLHAPNDEIRSRTMPVNRRWNVKELLESCRYYAKMTNRRISFEYAMISGVNDSDACAKELAQRLRGILSHVNLIPVNDVTGTGYRRSDSKRLQRFSGILENAGITVTVRRTLGSDIEASCGQLRRRNQQGGTLPCTLYAKQTSDNSAV